jgi:hypothetical protein
MIHFPGLPPAATPPLISVTPVTNLDHNRPVLQLIDALKRERAAAAAKSSGETIRKSIRAVTIQKDFKDRDRVHQAAVAVLVHLGQHFDLRVPAKLIDAIGNTRTSAALVTWLSLYGPLSATKDGALYIVKGKPTQVGPATLDPYWKHFPAAPKKEFDPIAELERVSRAIERSAKAASGPDRYVQLRKDLRLLLDRHRRD